jgi:hypothetical protein
VKAVAVKLAVTPTLVFDGHDLVTIAHPPHHLVYCIVGEQWEPRSHALREMLSVTHT